MSDLFYEIQEELKREKFFEFFQRHLIKIIALVLIFIISCIIYYIYESNKNSFKADLLNKYYLALELKDQNKTEEFIHSLTEIYGKKQCSISDIAGLIVAQEYYKQDKASKGQEILNSIAKSKCNKIISTLAEYLAINNSIDLNNNNDETLKKLEKLSKERSVLNYRAMLLRASLLISNKDYDKADKILENILQSDFATENIRHDAKILSDNIAYYKLVNYNK